MMRSIGIALAGALTLGAASAAHADWFVDASGAWKFDDNLSRGRKPGDIDKDTLFTTSIAAGWYRQLTDELGVSIGPGITLTQHARFDKLSNASFDLDGAINYKFGVGWEAPRLRAYGRVGYHNFRDRPRDGWHYALGLSFSKRIGDRLTIAAGYEFDKRWSDVVNDIPILVQLFNMGGDAFDTEGHTFSLTGTFAMTEVLTAYASYRRREGDVVSSTDRDLPVLLVSEATAFDPVFGPGKVAYRVDASTDIYGLGLSWALGAHASVNVGYERIRTEGPSSADYTSNIATVNVMLSY